MVSNQMDHVKKKMKKEAFCGPRVLIPSLAFSSPPQRVPADVQPEPCSYSHLKETVQ